MTNLIRSFMRDESGAAAAEYALILAVIGTAIGAAAFALGGSIKGAIDDAKTCIDDTQTC